MGQSCAPAQGSPEPRACLNGVCTNGVCGPRVPDLAAGQPCQPNTNPECSRGLQCVGGTCVPLVDVNGACDSQRRCKNDLSCGPANTCVRPAASGASCQQGQPCGSGLFCDRPAGASSGTCRPYRQPGEACANSGECGFSAFCTAASGGVCQLKGAVAAPCTLATRLAGCREGLYCTATTASPNGVCANLKSAGATCMSSDECDSRQCTSGRCEVPSFCQDPTP